MLGAAGTLPTLLGAPNGGSTVYAVHASQVFATPFSTLVNSGGVQLRLECVAINPVGTDLAYGTRAVVTPTGVRKQLMRLNLFTGAVATFITGTGYLTVNPSCMCRTASERMARVRRILSVCAQCMSCQLGGSLLL